MKITLLPSAYADSVVIPSQYLTTFLVNDRIAIDAGALGLYQTPQHQAAVRHVFLSHTHLDHWATLPIFLVNTIGMRDAPVMLYASDTVLDSLRRDVFNGRAWPNFLDMTQDNQRFVNVQPIRSGEAVVVEGLRITPVAVDHVVPTLGFILEDATSAVIITSDTAATTEIWERANRTANLKAVFLEATMPNELTPLAGVTRHLTPAGFVAEMRKLTQPVTFYAVHLSARARDQVIRELEDYRLPEIEIARCGVSYEFS